MRLEAFDKRYVITSKKKSQIYFKKAFLIVNRNTQSCAEILVQVLSKQFCVHVIGEETGGKLTIVKGYTVGDFRYIVPIGKFLNPTKINYYRISNKVIDIWLESILKSD